MGKSITKERATNSFLKAGAEICRQLLKKCRAANKTILYAKALSNSNTILV